MSKNFFASKLHNVYGFLVVVFTSTTASAAGGAGHKAGISSLGWYFFNFVVYCAILYFITRKPVAKAWAERCRKIALHVNAAQNKLSDAKARLTHAQAEQATVEARIQMLNSEIANATLLEQKRILVNALEQVQAIEKQADLLIEAERQAQMQAVEREVSGRVLERAEQSLRAEFQVSDDHTYRVKLSDNLKSLRGL